MNILFVHQNMPGQFKHLALRLAADPKNKVAFVTNRGDVDLPNVRRVTYGLSRRAGEKTHFYVRLYEDSVLYGQAVVRACQTLAREGFQPDIIVAHPGWGEALFLKDLYPRVPLLNFCEFYYHGRGADVGFDAEEPATLDDILRARARNAHLLISLEACDAGLSPTKWQRSVHPKPLRDKIRVIFDGIDTDYMQPHPDARFTLPDGRVLSRADEIVTYAVRNLEPHRGFPNFMRALPRLLELRPHAQVLVLGGDEVSYGRSPKEAANWREAMLKEVEVDPARVHFLGKLPYDRYRSVLQISSAHIYLTRPFVLSWSCIEAMSLGCLVIGSTTPPVQEVIADRTNGLLVDFHSPQAIAEKTAEALAADASLDPLRRRARETVLDRYALSKCLPAQMKLVRELAGR